MYRGRYAPSPTGPLHIGNALAASVAWQRAQRGDFLLRMEDLDTPRVIEGCAESQIEDLHWLGVTWDKAPVWQSQRIALYDAALTELLLSERAYYCTCSRKQIALASAPHGPGEDGPRYPGTCRGRKEKPDGEYSIRFRVEPGVVSYEDGLRGLLSQNVDEETGDFVIARRDGVIAYQLAVVVDDIEMGITEVVRGGDLVHSTPRQIQLYRALNAKPPAFAHTPLVLANDGMKLSKRDPRHTLAGLRKEGVSGPALRDACIAAAKTGLRTLPLTAVLP
jgi:glutamyl-tRNA synthetase